MKKVNQAQNGQSSPQYDIRKVYEKIIGIMDGIVGIVYPDIFQVTNLVQPMLDSLKHRTSKDSDIQTYKNIQLGLCGSKISSNQKKSIYLGLDGSIFNSNDILQELHKKGITLKNNDVQDILIKAYEIWGKEFLTKLTGDFALFILDKNKKRIVIARDRIGKKPLYWFKNHNFFLFSSELKALLSTGLIPQTAAQDAISSYLFFGYIPQDMTPIENVNKVLPAHYLQYHFSESISIEPYWSYSSYFEKTTKNLKKRLFKIWINYLRKALKFALARKHPLVVHYRGALAQLALQTI